MSSHSALKTASFLSLLVPQTSLFQGSDCKSGTGRTSGPQIYEAVPQHHPQGARLGPKYLPLVNDYSRHSCDDHNEGVCSILSGQYDHANLYKNQKRVFKG